MGTVQEASDAKSKADLCHFVDKLCYQNSSSGKY